MKYYELRRFVKFGLYKAFETKWKKRMQQRYWCGEWKWIPDHHVYNDHLKNYIYNTAGRWPRYHKTRDED